MHPSIPRPSSLTVLFILAAGVLAVSFGSIFVRLATEAAAVHSVGFSLVVSALRLTLASLVLIPAWGALRRAKLGAGAWRYAILAGVFLAVHFATWITSISYTSIAASVTLVNTNPIWVALISWVWLKQPPARLTILGITVAFIGGLIIALGGGLQPWSQPGFRKLPGSGGSGGGLVLFSAGAGSPTAGVSHRSLRCGRL